MQIRAHVRPSSSGRVLQRALGELKESIERFNRRWQEFLHQVDLTHVNRLRDGYNRYYLLEKECAVRTFALNPFELARSSAQGALSSQL